MWETAVNKNKNEGKMNNLIWGLVLLAVSVAAWLQHLFTCFTEGAWGFLIAGALFFPVAIVHGVGNWFGLW
jgi:hypothetical protein